MGLRHAWFCVDKSISLRSNMARAGSYTLYS
jgi:hypothetical protein